MIDNMEEDITKDIDKNELNKPLKKEKEKSFFSFFDSVNLFTGIVDFVKCLFK